ncbi:type II toxin-antitoxin system VapC family toxin [Methylosinus sp. C49]|uniref:type II toxin-antitoxin system VapC family toxin n=1 Tax=Methylosinus sp. C49 TaxID=2699395 RepID=UPI00137B46A6|nr:type II toxin-antitoxin system VapC family toxin [Methylosinus sp. C49]
MILLDTNVVSELVKARPHPLVLAWLDRHPFSSVWISTISVMELRFGLELLDPSRRKAELAAALARLTESTFGDRIAPFDLKAAEAAGRLAAARRRNGTTVDHRDTQIAGIALAHRARLVTRNLRDFADLDVEVTNPWNE